MSAAAGAPTPRSPRFYILVSLATSILTMGLKTGAYVYTGSVGLLSDALESGVNLAAALIALVALTYAQAGEDEDHNFGHQKAEYFSSGIEGTLIFLAAGLIIWAAVPRLIAPQPLEQEAIGLALSVVAAGANLLCGWLLLRGAREHHSITLEADARHLLTDVWTTVGVIAGVAVVYATDWLILDPLIAIAVAIQILFTGGSLIRRSFDGLMDRAIEREHCESIQRILEKARGEGADFHRLRTRIAGWKRYVDVHVLVPGHWTVQQGHDLVERIEHEIEAAVEHAEVLIHLEALEDPRSHNDAPRSRPGA